MVILFVISILFCISCAQAKIGVEPTLTFSMWHSISPEIGGQVTFWVSDYTKLYAGAAFADSLHCIACGGGVNLMFLPKNSLIRPHILGDCSVCLLTYGELLWIALTPGAGVHIRLNSRVYQIIEGGCSIHLCPLGDRGNVIPRIYARMGLEFLF
jgi:hypothetical protein